MGKFSPKPKEPSERSGKLGIIFVLIALFVVMSAVILADAAPGIFVNPTSPAETGNSLEQTEGTGDPVPDDTDAPTVETTVPTEPEVTDPVLVSTASVGVTGDILLHMPVNNAAKAASGSGAYDYSSMLQYIAPYFESYDFMVANLETTLGGSEAGSYSGYPAFNSPDSIVEDLLDAGVDMMLTANNHTYDTGYKGMIRTQQVMIDAGMLHLGTVQSEEEKLYTVQEINGIKIGMICCTYETGRDEQGRKQLNGITLSTTAGPLVCSFSYNNLSAFYSELSVMLTEMEAAGAEASMVYIHWGEENYLNPTSAQKDIAQNLCDLGVDVIVGGHPHVIQPFATLTGEEGNTTYCIYSTGNALSNQRRDTLSTENARYTEDGMIFGVEFEKWSDGTVEVSEVSILPTWVNKEWRTDRNIYAIIPLDAALESWSNYDVTISSRLAESYNRTMSQVGVPLNECRTALGLEEVPLTRD